jgi:hypothetical protein
VKFYYRYPDRALGGMADLNLAQRGAYNSIIDLLYARDGIVPCLTPADDIRIAKSISVDPRTWRKFKSELLALGKIRVTNDGLLDANGVSDERFRAESYSETQRKRVSIRWQNYKLAKQFNGGVIPGRYYHKIEIENSEIPSPKEHASPQNVDDVENDESFGLITTDKSADRNIATGELEAVIRAKGWKA